MVSWVELLSFSMLIVALVELVIRLCDRQNK